MKTKKQIGKYYTPEFLARFIVQHIAPHLQDRTVLKILEPSVGDGIFLKMFNELSLPETIKKIQLECVEKYKSALNKAELNAFHNADRRTNYSFVHDDFLRYQRKSKKKFSFILGNPPYIRKSLLSKTQIKLCQEIHIRANLNPSIAKNIWSSFVVSCCSLLDENGIMAFVLPAELFQMTFSKDIKNYLVNQFDRIETFTFDELIFNQIGQDTVLLICYKNSKEKGRFYCQINDQSQLARESYTLSPNESLVSSQMKWMHHILTGEEIELLERIKKDVKSISSYCSAKPGIVTAANNYFIVDEIIEKQYNLKSYTKPIIQRGLFVNGSIVFDNDDLSKIRSEGRATKLLCFPNLRESYFDNYVNQFFQLGKKNSINKRYKCSQRDYWFAVPNIGEPPKGFFFKRCHYYPKLLKNEANVLVTDSAYKIEPLKEFFIEDIIYSFYNSFTLCYAEIEGRYYGGGVLELTPSEFKKLPLPYYKISQTDFDEFRKRFEQKENIDDVLILQDQIILEGSLNLTIEDIKKIQTIKNKLVSKRLRANSTAKHD
jgi:adenine-specific DNA-methyltransferase